MFRKVGLSRHSVPRESLDPGFDLASIARNAQAPYLMIIVLVLSALKGLRYVSSRPEWGLLVREVEVCAVPSVAVV